MTDADLSQRFACLESGLLLRKVPAATRAVGAAVTYCINSDPTTSESIALTITR